MRENYLIPTQVEVFPIMRPWLLVIAVVRRRKIIAGKNYTDDDNNKKITINNDFQPWESYKF